jgi:hypothetical protein
VKLGIQPEPTPEERSAIEQALAAAAGERRAGARGAWWQAGIDEALSRDDAGDVPGGHW